MRYILSIFLFFVYSYCSACYNEFYALDSKGQFHQVDIGTIRFHKSFDNRVIQKQLLQLKSKLQTNQDHKLLSDYGLYLVKGGKVNEALVIFETLALAYPNEYSIIANLGTTYELSGQNEKALQYIRKGLEINPNSHGESEWIHVKILEAKIAMAKNPKHLENNTVLNLTSKQEESEKVRNQLYIQLQERFPFCQGPDPIMSDLFEDLGDCYLHSISFEHAKGLYQLAKNYYHSESSTLDEKINLIAQLRSKYHHLEPTGSEVEHGMVSKINGVPYKSFLVDKNPSNYTIDWSKIESDPKKLLAYLGLEPKKAEETETKPEKTSINNHPTKAKQKEFDEASNISAGLIFGILLCVISLIFILLKKTKKR